MKRVKRQILFWPHTPHPLARSWLLVFVYPDEAFHELMNQQKEGKEKGRRKQGERLPQVSLKPCGSEGCPVGAAAGKGSGEEWSGGCSMEPPFSICSKLFASSKTHATALLGSPIPPTPSSCTQGKALWTHPLPGNSIKCICHTGDFL